jgi:ketol-acid reductoisomerase
MESREFEKPMSAFGNKKMRQLSDNRKILVRGLVDMLESSSKEITKLGFSPELARFDCLQTLRSIVEDMYDQCDVGLARREWYREYSFLFFENTKK